MRRGMRGIGFGTLYTRVAPKAMLLARLGILLVGVRFSVLLVATNRRGDGERADEVDYAEQE